MIRCNSNGYARYFGGDAQSWLNLQQSYDLKVTQKQKFKQIEAEIEPLEQ